MIFGILGLNEWSVIERCPYYRGVRKERLDCSTFMLFYKSSCQLQNLGCHGDQNCRNLEGCMAA